MPEVQPSVDALGNVMSPPEPRAAVFWDGTHWRVASVDAAGNVQVDVIASGLPAGAATAAAQALILAQLQLIEDMRDALQSVATDRLIVRGEDQLFSIGAVVGRRDTSVISGADGYVNSGSPPAGTYWVITTVYAWDGTSPTTAIGFRVVHNGAMANFHNEIAAFAAAQPSQWAGHVFLDTGDVVRATFTGGLVGDTCSICLCGYQMTLET